MDGQQSNQIETVQTTIIIKDAEKTAKYGPLRWKLKHQYPGYEVKQFNVIIDVLGGWSVDVEETMKDLTAVRCFID